MKTFVTGLIAAVLAMSVFATAGFASFVPQPSTSIQTYVSTSGVTAFAEQTGNENGAVLQNFNNFGTFVAVTDVNAFGDDAMQTFAGLATTGDTTVKTLATWQPDADKFGRWTISIPTTANVYTGVSSGGTTDVVSLSNTIFKDTGAFEQNIKTEDSLNYVGSVGINMPTLCVPTYPTPPVSPVCPTGHCFG